MNLDEVPSCVYSAAFTPAFCAEALPALAKEALAVDFFAAGQATDTYIRQPAERYSGPGPVLEVSMRYLSYTILIGYQTTVLAASFAHSQAATESHLSPLYRNHPLGTIYRDDVFKWHRTPQSQVNLSRIQHSTRLMPPTDVFSIANLGPYSPIWSRRSSLPMTKSTCLHPSWTELYIYTIIKSFPL